MSSILHGLSHKTVSSQLSFISINVACSADITSGIVVSTIRHIVQSCSDLLFDGFELVNLLQAMTIKISLHFTNLNVSLLKL